MAITLVNIPLKYFNIFLKKIIIIFKNIILIIIIYFFIKAQYSCQSILNGLGNSKDENKYCKLDTNYNICVLDIIHPWIDFN